MGRDFTRTGLRLAEAKPRTDEAKQRTDEATRRLTQRTDEATRRLTQRTDEATRRLTQASCRDRVDTEAMKRQYLLEVDPDQDKCIIFGFLIFFLIRIYLYFIDFLYCLFISSLYPYYLRLHLCI